MALSPMGDRQDQTAAAKETTASGVPMYFIFAPKYLDNRPQNTSVNLDKLCFSSFSWSEIMQYFRSFKSYKNIRNTKCPISTHPAKKKKLLHAMDANVLLKREKWQFFSKEDRASKQRSC